MKTLKLVAFLAVMGLAGANAIGLETQQSIEYYAGTGPCPVAAGAYGAPCGSPCGYSCPCPMECPCTPVCCPANRGLFDGGVCCGGRAVI